MRLGRDDTSTAGRGFQALMRNRSIGPWLASCGTRRDHSPWTQARASATVYERTMLHQVRCFHPALVVLAALLGAPGCVSNDSGARPLHNAAVKNDTAEAESLLRRGRDVNQLAAWDYTPLY